MDSVSDISKYHLLCFVAIIEVKVRPVAQLVEHRTQPAPGSSRVRDASALDI